VVYYDSNVSGPSSCTLIDYNLTGYTLVSGTCNSGFNSVTGDCNGVRSNVEVRAEWELANTAPTEPGDPWVDGTANPSVAASITPSFTAIFNDPDEEDYSTQYQVQVNTQADFNGTIMWDSGLTAKSSNTPRNERTEGIVYAGTPLNLDGTTYYWRMKLSDSHGLTSPWSTCSTTCEFTMNQEPTEPTTLWTEGDPNPSGISTLNPSFSAIFNDPDGHDGGYYQIQVNTASDFSGTSMWDSGLQEMTVTPNGTRSPDIEYDGTAPSFDGSTYYWRIRFADEHGTTGAWSIEEAYFTMNEPPTAPSDLLTENLTDPIDISTAKPKFSAIFNDPDIVDTSSYFQIQINTNSSFTGSTMWDSSKSSMATTDKGQRSPEIEYNGSTLRPNGVMYYWRIKFWDSVDSASPWSPTATFTMEENETPSAPSGLLTDGRTNHQRVNSQEPVFSGIFEDPNSFDFSNYYEIEVNTQDDFAGTVMWDSGKEFMDTKQKGERSPDITYDGSELSLDGTTYYWRIRFWDSSDVASPWGATYFMTSGAYSTYDGIRFDGNIKLD
jgi:hypothetical protein